MQLYKPLLYLVRKGVVDQEFYGLIQRYKCNFALTKQEQRPIFMGSLLAPIQASLIDDYSADKNFDFTKEEMAIFCASHTAQDYHIKLIRSILEKIGLDESHLKCGTHPAIVPRQDKSNRPVHNNSSGVHAAMLALCVQNGWDTNTYTDFYHPVQKAILNKLVSLSSAKRPIATYDFSGTPMWGMPLDNIAKAFFELYNGQPIIKESINNYPLIISGETRLDTKIMLLNKKLVAKIGSGGFIVVYHTEINEMIVIKMAHDDNRHREMITSIALNQLEWLDSPLVDTVLENSSFQVVGMYKPAFRL